MTGETAINTYYREVKRAVELPRNRKRDILNGFRQELTERFSTGSEVSDEAIYREAGTPQETAMLLMEGIPQEERDRYRRQKRRRTCALIAGLAAALLLVIGLVVHMWSNNGLVVIETTHYEDGVLPEDFPMGGEGRVIYQYDN